MSTTALRAQKKLLIADRLKLIADARKILDKASAEKREMASDEKESWDQMMSEVDSLKERIDQLERMADAEDDDGGAEGEDEDREDFAAAEEDGATGRDAGEDGEGEDTEDGDGKADEDDDDDDDESGERSGRFVRINGKRYRIVLKRGGRGKKQRRSGRRTPPGGAAAQRNRRRVGESEHEFRTRQRRNSPEYRQVWQEYLLNGKAALSSRLAQRAIQADSDIVGGYLVAPQEFVGALIKFVDNILWIRQRATTYTVANAQSLGAPSLDSDVSDANWTSELDTGNEDSSMAFGKRELTPHPLAKRLKVSNRLLRMANVASGFSADGSVSGGGAEGLVRARLGYKFAVTEEKAFLLGNGAQQPLGVFVASSRGIDTSRDVLTGNSTGFTADGLIAAKYNQKVQYWPELEWLFHRTGIQLIRQLKDANGQYLWVPGGFGGEADTLLDLPVMMSEYAPNTFTTGQYVGLLGAFRFYWIADAETLQIQRLVELYAAANQTGFIARMELDGMPVLAEAFTRLKTN